MSIFAAPNTPAEDYRQARMTEERTTFGIRTEWAPSRVDWLYRHAGKMTSGDPLATTKLLENLRRETRDDQGEMARLLLERSSSWADRLNRGTGEHIMLTMPIGVVAHIRADDGYLPLDERITHYDGLDAALVTWRHARGPQYQGKTVGRIIATDRSQHDPRVFIRIADNCPDILTASRYGELGGSIGYTPAFSERTVGPANVLDTVDAAVGEVSLCHRSEAAYNLRVRHAVPTADLLEQHRRAMLPNTPPGQLHLRGRAARPAPRLLAAGLVGSDGVLRYA